MQLTRRKFLQLGVSAAAALMSPIPAHSALGPSVSTERALSFYNIHTTEDLTVSYRRNGRYIPEAIDHINHILRDFRTGEIKPIDPRLIDLLWTVGKRCHCQGRFHIISGYRSPKTNAWLWRHTTGVAKNSLHMRGKAIDIRLPDVCTRKLRDISLSLQAGGVGYYPRSDFVHLDLGDVRSW
jgi:uncharacterized protein YcbK (DUF882 family)